MLNAHWIKLDEVDSTNDFLRHLETPSDCSTTLVTAEFQTAGRGADRNHWESAKGENLLLSLRVMPASLPAARMFTISEITALAVKEALDTFIVHIKWKSEKFSSFSIKWPNDIYYGDDKVAGVLIENDLQGSKVLRSIIGIGINVNQRCFLSDAPNPCSLADIVGHDVERLLVLEEFMSRFKHYMQQIDDGSTDVLDALHHSYVRHLYRRDEEHSYSDALGTFRATLIDVEPTGHLILRDTEGTFRRYAFKEVRYGFPKSL